MPFNNITITYYKLYTFKYKVFKYFIKMFKNWLKSKYFKKLLNYLKKFK